MVQGFGKVGGVAALELAERGAVITGVSDVSGGAYDERDDVDRPSNAELLELPCDVLVLAALEGQVTAANAPRLRARLVAEGANRPTTLEADAVLADRGIRVLPDVLTNAGGVTVSYFEVGPGLGRLFWGREEIRRRLADKLGDASDRVWASADAARLSLRQAALVAGIREVAAALDARGLFP